MLPADCCFLFQLPTITKVMTHEACAYWRTRVKSNFRFHTSQVNIFMFRFCCISYRLCRTKIFHQCMLIRYERKYKNMKPCSRVIACRIVGAYTARRIHALPLGHIGQNVQSKHTPKGAVTRQPNLVILQPAFPHRWFFPTGGNSEVVTRTEKM